MKLYYKQIYYPYEETYLPNSAKIIYFEDSILTTYKCLCLSYYDFYNQDMTLCSYKCYNESKIRIWLSYKGDTSILIPENSMHIGIIYTSK